MKVTFSLILKGSQSPHEEEFEFPDSIKQEHLEEEFHNWIKSTLKEKSMDEWTVLTAKGITLHT